MTLRSKHISPNKSLGQHWLHDRTTLVAMCDAAEVTTQDTILEVGPGLGTLTEYLVERADQVVAVEFDKTLAKRLPKEITANNLTVHQQDILRFDTTNLPAGYKVVANIPYYLTSNLIRQLSESPNPPAMAVLLVQKEVAERVAAAPGDMSLLSVSAQYYWLVSLGMVVGAELFTPPPKIDSQILILKCRTEQLFDGVDDKRFFTVVKAGFSARRKTLHNSLAGGLRLEKSIVSVMLEKAGIANTLRPQELSLNDWYKVYQAFLGVIS